jgi:hypothetical protein
MIRRHPLHRTWKSIGAVVAGFCVTFVLSVATDAILHLVHWFPPAGERMSDGLFLIAAGYRAAFTIAGGYVTAKLAPDRPFGHAVVLAVIGTAAGSLGVLAYYMSALRELGPAWYAFSLPLMAIPCVLAGALLSKGNRVEQVS